MTADLMSSLPPELADVAHRPGDEVYAAAATVYVRTGSPALVVRPQTPEQVAAAIQHAIAERTAAVDPQWRAQRPGLGHQRRRPRHRHVGVRRRRGARRRPGPRGCRRSVGRRGEHAGRPRALAHLRRHQVGGRRRAHDRRRHRLDGAQPRPDHRQPGCRGHRHGRRPCAAPHRDRERRPLLGDPWRRRQLRRAHRLRVRAAAGDHRARRDDHVRPRRRTRPAARLDGRPPQRARGAQLDPGVLPRARRPDAAGRVDGPGLLRGRRRGRGRSRLRAALVTRHGADVADRREAVRRRARGGPPAAGCPVDGVEHPRGARGRPGRGRGRPLLRGRHHGPDDVRAPAGRRDEPGRPRRHGLRPPQRGGPGARRPLRTRGHLRRRAAGATAAVRGVPRSRGRLLSRLRSH